ncbi:hypothetical protein CAPGI0001_0283 [Capnocytophaga gingivalis ATCC 33624]|uniref:DUF4132 domain-containing protein n=1 Tax=Capnocytophaga gingivalis TaxID=1017 RepID=UPI00019FB3CA|nr:DUF4132 domain-containing protein [Capnocytophaga gingivalis]EEK15201.1 hypothetical protein CAPGI0001_0283 [Capnocytophaga gingivalis ATCC 33624]
MIEQEQVNQYLAPFKAKELKKEDLASFSQSYQKLGEYILNKSSSKEQRHLEANFPSLGLPDKLWETKEGKALATLLFSEVQAPYIQRVWDIAYQFPYSYTYNRRPFRSPNPEDYRAEQLRTLKRLRSFYNVGVGALSVEEQFQYAFYKGGEEDFFVVVLSENPDAYYPLFEEIFFGEHEIGGVCESLIKAALMVKDPRYHTLVEKLLLAAQLQEGLRQTILESLDETTIPVLQHFIALILEHNLTRFSSVVRAVDVWFGFGWEAPQQAVVKRTLELAQTYLVDLDKAREAVSSKDNVERYVALWAVAVYNVQEALSLATEALNNTQTSYEACVAVLYFMYQTQKKTSEILPFAEKYFGIEPAWDYWILQNLPKGEIPQELFEKMRTAAHKLPKDGKNFEGLGFRWLNFTVKPLDIYQSILKVANEQQQQILAGELAEIPVDVRHILLDDIFPVLSRGRYSYYSEEEKNLPPEDYPADSWQRTLVRTALNDKGPYVVSKAMEVLKKVPLVQDDILALEQVLSRKNKEQRKESVALLVKQPEAVLKDSTSRMIVSKNADQRLAALEILTILQEEGRLTDYVTEQVEAYKGRKLSKNEQVLMDKLTYNPETATELRYDLTNGFGVLNLDNLTSFDLPKPQFDKERKEKKVGFLFDKLVNIQKVGEGVSELLALWRANKDYEYQYEGYQGATETILLGNVIRRQHKGKDDETPMEILEDLPLTDLWKGWHEKYQFNEVEYYFAKRYCGNLYYENAIPQGLDDYLAMYYPDFKVRFEGQVHSYYGEARRAESLLGYLMNAYSEDRALLASFKLSVFEDALATFPKEKRGEIYKRGYSSLDWDDVVTDYAAVVYYGDDGDFPYYTDDQLFRLWQILYYLYIEVKKDLDAQKNTIKDVLPYVRNFVRREERLPGINEGLLQLTLMLYNKGRLTTDDLIFFCLLNNELFAMAQGAENHFSRRLPKWIKDTLTFPEILLEEIRTHMLQVELQRGDLPTDASVYISSLSEIEGAQYFFEALERMGKEPFAKGYGSGVSKRFTFSRILEVSQPSATDTFTAFKKHLDEVKLDKKRLVEAACYAPHWTEWIGDYLKIKSFREAVWWFIAHTTDYMDAEKETIVSQYSSVPRDDFQRGAIDVDWYHRVHKAVGKEGWKLIQESAKYLSEGMGYRRVKLYSAVLTGEIKLSEVIQKITEKRDKDYVMALGLVPINKKKEEEDLVSRYNLLQTFLKESKQFGQQRQESEKNAVEIGLDNLSRNAGYEDSIRFSWAMEAKATQQIMEKATLTLDDTTIRLVIDEQGKAELEVTKGDKTLKSVPDKYKKSKEVEALKEGKTYLTKQYSRTRLSLEQAMLSQTLFTVAELHRIMEHPVVRAMLSKLVLFNPETQASGFWQDGHLLNAEGEKVALKADDKLLIAHPSHLFYAVQWDLYQKYLFDKELKQPFKQVFRELYIPTKDELETSNRSERYQGHQVQPQKTVALLRSRGWTVNYEEGLQRVYHKEGFRATIYAAADWYTPSDVEAPTLEYVVFYSLKDGKEVPMKEINPVIFSEVMRDVDLVVSVAHVGGVDPEASHSTMQMRAALARESARLFKLTNVEVKERHILVKGKLGEYSIHLGSSMVSRGGLQLSILAVQSQHRGRVFLPFVDDDPKSAEIISKMRLLAEDDKIKDPTILRQIK